MDMDYNDIAVFVEVAAHGGFTAAARVLDLPTSAVSRRVARLENHLGYPLLHRTTRKVGLTPAGRLFFDRVGALPRLVREARTAAEQAQAVPSGIVRVTAPPDDGGVIWELLRGFSAAHPEVDLHLIHTLDKLDLVENEIDLALRGGPAPNTDLYVAHNLLESRILLAASPEYLALHGTPARVEDLANHLGVCMDPWVPNAIRTLQGEAAPVSLRMRNRIHANSMQTAHNAALDGLGIAPLLEMTCRADLARGSLVEVLRGALPPSSPFWAIVPLARVRNAATEALLTHVKQAAQRQYAG